MAQKDLNVILGLDVENFMRGIKRTERQLQKFSRQMQNVGRDMTQMITLPIAGAAAGAIKAAADFEQLETSFSVLLGSAEEGAKLFKELQQFSASTPFQLKDISDAARQLLAFGFSADQAKSSLQFLGDVSAGSGNQIGELAQIFGQVAGAGKLTAERLNQLQERAVPISSALAATMGVAESSIRDLVSAGQVSFSDFEAAFRSLAEEGGLFAGGMEKQSKTLAGVFSTFRDNIALAFGEIGKSIVDVFNLKEAMVAITAAVQNAVKWFQSLDDRTKKIIISVAAAAAAMGPLLIIAGKAASIAAFLTTGFKNLVVAVNFLKGALAALSFNPIVLGITAVAGVLVLAYKHSETFRTAVDGAFRAAGVAAAWLGEKLSGLWVIIRNVGGLFMDVARGIFNAGKTYFSAVARIASPVIQGMADGFLTFGRIVKDVFRVSLILGVGFVRGMATAFNELISIVREGVRAFVDAFDALKSGDIAGALAAFKEGLKKGNPIGIALTQGGRLAGSFREGFAKGVLDVDQLFSDMKDAYQSGINQTVADINVPTPALPGVTPTATTPAGSGGGAVDMATPATQGVSLLIEKVDTLRGSISSLPPITLPGLAELPSLVDPVNTRFETIRTQLEDLDRRAQAFGQTAGETLPEKLTILQEALYQALSANAPAEQIALIREQLDETRLSMEAITEETNNFNATMQAAAAGFAAGMDLVTKNTEEGKKAFQGLGSVALAEAAKVIKAQIQQAIATQIAKVLSFLPPPFNLAAAAGVGAIVSALFQRAITAIGIPALAEGGIVTKPTLALIGERGPEAVVPLGGEGFGSATINLAGEFILRGSDLLLAVERAERQQNRVR